MSGRLLARELDDATILVRTGFDEREQLLRDHPAVFHVPPRFDAHMVVAMRLSQADAAVADAALRAAWLLQTAG